MFPSNLEYCCYVCISCSCLHSPLFLGSNLAQSYTLKQAKALAMTALDIMCQPELVKKMKNELQETLKTA